MTGSLSQTRGRPDRLRTIWNRFVHWLRCGGGYGLLDPRTGMSQCGLCGFVYRSPADDGGAR